MLANPIPCAQFCLSNCKLAGELNPPLWKRRKHKGFWPSAILLVSMLLTEPSLMRYLGVLQSSRSPGEQARSAARTESRSCVNTCLGLAGLGAAACSIPKPSPCGQAVLQTPSAALKGKGPLGRIPVRASGGFISPSPSPGDSCRAGRWGQAQPPCLYPGREKCVLAAGSYSFSTTIFIPILWL